MVGLVSSNLSNRWGSLCPRHEGIQGQQRYSATHS